MVFSIIVIVLIAVIAYFHYTQGAFSATLSAIIAIIAAVLAFSYHETIIYSFLKGKVADYAHGMVLVALFAVIYVVLRIIFDSLVPGNIRLPLWVDRIGAGVMGLFVGVYATGILTIAAHTLPFGPGTPYARYELEASRSVTVPTGGRDLDASVIGQVKDAEPGRFSPETASSMIVPVDDIVVNMVDRLSGGALSGKQTLKSVHPSYLDEMFANRLGVQVGASHVAFNLPTIRQIDVQGVYSLDQIAQADSEYPQLRGPMKIDAIRKPQPDQALLVARVNFATSADDSDRNVRVSAATVRLLAGGVNHMPVGTIDPAGILRVNLPDDFIIVPAGNSVDFVFQVPRADLGLEPASRGKPAEGAGAVKDGVFIEVKRMGQVELGGKRLEPYPGPLENSALRKKNLPEPTAPPTAAAPGATPAAASAPVSVDKVEVSDKLFTSVNVGALDDGQALTFASGTATLKDKKFQKLTINTTQTVALLSQGDYPTSEFFVPPGMKMVQIVGKPGESDAWQWADKLAQFELSDETGAKHKPRGAWAKLKAARGSDRMVARYDADADVNELSPEEGHPIEVTLAFLVPEGTKLKELLFDGKRVAPVTQQVR
jgi:hypothetical protein